MRLGIVDDADRGVLLEQFGERLAELDVVLALLGSDCDRQHRRMGNDFADRRMWLLAVAQSIAGLGMIELAECDGLARFGGTTLLASLPHELENGRDTSGLPVHIREIGAVSDFSREHAGHRHLAAMRGIDGLEHVSNSLTRLHAE